MKENITTELSNALKNGDKERIHTLRLVLAAIKDKEIASRSSGEDSTISDDTVISPVSYTHLTLPTTTIV